MASLVAYQLMNQRMPAEASGSSQRRPPPPFALGEPALQRKVGQGHLFAAITDPLCPESQLTAVPPSVESLRASRVTIVPFLLSAEARNMDRSRYRRWVISRRPARTGAGAGCGPGNQPT